MVSLAVLQQLNDLRSSQLFSVFLGYLHYQLQVLLHVGCQKLLQQHKLLRIILLSFSAHSAAANNLEMIELKRQPEAESLSTALPGGDVVVSTEKDSIY